ncbi:MAG: trypsin-like peptidase domain-containing protein [Verrucomicrobiota bacterium]
MNGPVPKNKLTVRPASAAAAPRRQTGRPTGRALLAAAAIVWGTTSVLPAAEADVRRDAAVEAIERVMPSVVNISTKTVVQRRGYFYDWWRDNWAPFYQELPPQYSAGSGVIIDEEGYVLTNVHVAEGAQEIWVKLSGKEPRIIRAQPIVGTAKTDVALLKLLGEPGEKFSAATFAADDDLLLGETVMALGNPFGLGGSVSRGILSSKPRRTSAGNKRLELEDWLQTDAAINPGNSGGPLINLRGEIIGLNVAIYREGQGIGFAIPAKRLSEALAEIFTPEIKSLWFGARFHGKTNGIVVVSVEAGSPADKAGLQPDDAILRVNQRIPQNVFQLNRELITVGDSEDIPLAVQRGQERKNVTVRLIPEKEFFNAALIREKLGATLQELTAELAERMGLSSAAGLIIAGVDKNGPAEKAGLQRGLLIQAIDGQIPEDLTAAAKVLHGRKKGEKVQLSVLMPRPLRLATVDVKLR